MAKSVKANKIMSIGQNVELGWEAEAADMNLGNQTLEQVKALGAQAQGTIDALAKLRNATRPCSAAAAACPANCALTGCKAMLPIRIWPIIRLPA